MKRRLSVEEKQVGSIGRCFTGEVKVRGWVESPHLDSMRNSLGSHKADLIHPFVNICTPLNRQRTFCYLRNKNKVRREVQNLRPEAASTNDTRMRKRKVARLSSSCRTSAHSGFYRNSNLHSELLVDPAKIYLPELFRVVIEIPPFVASNDFSDFRMERHCCVSRLFRQPLTKRQEGIFCVAPTSASSASYKTPISSRSDHSYAEMQHAEATPTNTMFRVVKIFNRHSRPNLRLFFL